MSGTENNDITRLETAFSTDEVHRAPGSCPSDEELWASASGEIGIAHV